MRNLMIGCSVLFLLGCLESDGPLLASPAVSPTSYTRSLLWSSSSAPWPSSLDHPKILLLGSSGTPPQILFLRLRATGSSASSSQISPPPAPSLPSASSDAPVSVVESFPIAPEGERDSQTPVSSDVVAGVVKASAEPTDTSPEDLDNIREILELEMCYRP